MRLPYTALLVFFVFSTYSQDLFPEDGRVFSDDSVPRVEIDLADEDLEILLDPNHIWSNDLFQASFKWTDGNGVESLKEVGLRLRGNTSRQSAKKSFKIKFKAFGGDEFYGLSDLNLNGEHNDPSVARSKLSWDMMKLASIPSARANHVELYINGHFFGLYANVEHIDKDYLNVRYNNPKGNLYKMNYGCDFKDRGSDPNNYKVGGSNRIFELKTNEELDDYSQLANFMQILNDISNPDYRCDLESVFDVNLYLRSLAMEVLLGHFDSPAFNQNNGYLYEDPESGQIKYIPFDLDNTFGIFWGNVDMASINIYNWQWSNTQKRIYKQMMIVPEYRYLFGFYINQYVNTFFNVSELSEKINTLRNQLKPFIENDEYYTYSYGFNAVDFWTSFNFGLGEHVPYGIKEFVSKRVTTVKSQLNDIEIIPILEKQQVTYSDLFYFKVSSFAYAGQSVMLHYNINNNGWNELQMLDKGQTGDEFADDMIFTVGLDLEAEDRIEYYFSAINSINYSVQLPKCDGDNFHFIVPDVNNLNLFINEVMASNDSYPDEFGEFDDWIELYNKGRAQTLINLYLTDEKDYYNKWQLPNTTIENQNFLLLWADDDDTQGALHTNFKLKATGESLWLYFYNGSSYIEIDNFKFENASDERVYGRFPNGEGPVVELGTPTPNRSNVLTTNVKELSDLSLQVSPNPSSNQLFIRSNSGNHEINILDVNGIKVYSSKLDLNGSKDIDVHKWKVGLYIIRIKEDSDSFQTFKFIKY